MLSTHSGGAYPAAHVTPSNAVSMPSWRWPLAAVCSVACCLNVVFKMAAVSSLVRDWAPKLLCTPLLSGSVLLLLCSEMVTGLRSWRQVPE